uniref:Rav1p_C domain-containing protein n=1 Tax=Mesocestoides corti TaxID=53468 RepID=A0A5K3F7D5_MESCO
MQLHQIIAGSCNKTGGCISSLKYLGSFYIIYGSGKSVVFLDESLLQIQSITATFGASGKEIVSLACEDFGGLIAVSDGETVAVFEPTVS